MSSLYRCWNTSRGALLAVSSSHRRLPSSWKDGLVASTARRRWMSGDAGSDRLHSTDIAFKPAESGWGGGQKYANNFDRIFAQNNQTSTVQDSKPTIASTSPTAGTTTDATTKSDEGKRA